MAREKVTERAEAVPVSENTEPKFRLDKLCDNHAHLFGVDESTFIGATASLSEDKEFTVSEIRNTIEKWCRQEVK